MERTFCKFCNLKSAAAQKLSEDEIDVLENNCAEVKFETGDVIIRQDALSTNVAYVRVRIGENSYQRPV